MSQIIPPKIAILLALSLVVAFVGCTHQKTKRGHLFRGDWAVEYNRTPWIGCPADSGYYEDDDAAENRSSLFPCLAKDANERPQKKYRHHCALNNDCSAKNPCCRTLGCGMWVDPNDPAMNASLGGAARACGLLPFCTPQKPCCLTPTCGRPANVNVNLQTLMMASQNTGVPGRNTLTSNGIATVRGMNPTGMNPTVGIGLNGSTLNDSMAGGTVNVIPGGGTIAGVTLVSRGIVPGASAISSGGMVAAIGVATPAGIMTPVGVRLPGGVVSNAIVLRACVMTPNCTAARPCCLTPNCGGPVAVNMVATNATVLASALQAQGIAGGVMQASGMGTLVNPITNQPISGLTMGGYPQAGYPPIGYAPYGHAPGYPRYATGGVVPREDEEMYNEEMDESIILPETRSSMPVPRFQAIPNKPAFQRSEGMGPAARPATNAMNSRNAMSEMELEAALDQAYLEGVAAAMDELEQKLESKRQAAAKAQLQAKILQQAEYVQQQLDIQEEMRIMAMQRERQLRQQTLRQAGATAVQEPQRLAPQNMITVNQRTTSMSAAKPVGNVNVAQIAGTLKASVLNGVNDMFAPLLGSNSQHVPVAAQLQPQQNATQPRSKQEFAAVQPDVPIRPPVLPRASYGLSDEETESYILQAHFTGDDTPIRP